MGTEIQFVKYQGAGNDFVLVDMREIETELNDGIRKAMCDRRFGIGADGVLVILNSAIAHFKLVYYNSDGCLSSLCGNGSRCCLAYYLSMSQCKDSSIRFECNGSIYEGGHVKENIYQLNMKDIETADIVTVDKDNFYINTGSPHHVRYVNGLHHKDIRALGLKVRTESYGKEGCNINFCEELSDGKLKVRTYERGVEDETLACGTGATAVALVTHQRLKIMKEDSINSCFSYVILMPGGTLTVKFVATAKLFSNIYLIGPALRVFTGVYNI
ncbi:hypothetical protein LOTGIDRAFT_162386 [Lottia gigantea]|uniref:Diaminopimelate epimerase n=1 Tax=Lottia gigantea TaxID=225164 RepID=V4AHP3_LOTGI|nr:hypothetical protein LOTGIDRAFT_162386 [Lottia gigantea]ESO92906.1 hypothetical protein LOTGIDRAFT_162386 [Lottia gigantea]